VLRLALRNLIEFRVDASLRVNWAGLVRTPHLRNQMQRFWILDNVR
jgi:hypothetical protein